MRMLLCGGVLLLLGVSCLTGPVVADEKEDASAKSPFTNLTLEKAMAKAKAEKKMVFVDFYADWCGPCKMLDTTTWKDDKVQAWLKKNTIAIKVDVDKFEALVAKHKVEAMPTMILLAADGKEKKRVVGYRDANGFMKEFGSVKK